MTATPAPPVDPYPKLDAKAQARLEKYAVELVRNGDAVHATDVQNALLEIRRLRLLLLRD